MAIKKKIIWGSNSKSSVISLKMNPNALSMSLGKNSKKLRKFMMIKWPNLNTKNLRYKR
jgi:hypothetical protein